jgi:hypothetical protein
MMPLGPAPKTTIVTLVEDQPALLTVLHVVDRQIRSTSFEVFRKTGTTVAALAILGAMSGLPEDARWEETKRFIRECLEGCIAGGDGHEMCRGTGRVVPTRLIQIDHEGKWRVVRFDFNIVKNAALSHCWGKEPLPKLLKAMPDNEGNVAERFRRSGQSVLPLAFKDAMYRAHAAGSSGAGAIPFLCPRPPEFKHWSLQFHRPEKPSVLGRVLGKSITFAKRSCNFLLGLARSNTVRRMSGAVPFVLE